MGVSGRMSLENFEQSVWHMENVWKSETDIGKLGGKNKIGR